MMYCDSTMTAQTTDDLLTRRRDEEELWRGLESLFLRA